VRTLLVSSKMNPALAARVRQSLRSPLAARKEGGAPPKAPWRRSALRVFVAGFLGLAIYGVTSAVQRQRAELEFARQSLIATVNKARGLVSDVEHHKVELSQQWLQTRLRDGSLVNTSVPDLRARIDAAQLLQRRTLYVRGPWQGGFGNAAEIAHSAAESRKDALLYCWLDPPPSPSEKDLVKAVDRVHRATSEFTEKTTQVFRLEDALTALRFVSPGWSDPISRLPSREQVALLERAWEHAQIEHKLEATRAELLFAVFDEPKQPGTPVELDGASRHAIRVALVDLVQDQLLLYRVVESDPTWISEARRVRLASGIESCRVAFELRRALTTTTN
jgi:hypothetical protein